MLNAPLARVFRRMVSRVKTPSIRNRRIVLEVTQNTLEGRYAPAALAAPIVDNTSLLFQRGGPPLTTVVEYTNAQSAVNPENPLRQVVVAEEDDTAGSGGAVNDSYIVAKSTLDGGATWTSFARFGGGQQFSADGFVFRDPTVASDADNNAYYRLYSSPTATITRDGQVYVSFLAHNAAGSSGVLAVRRFDFSPTQGVPVAVSMDPLGRDDGISAQVTQWNQADIVLTPVIASDPNPKTYTDPDSGTVMDDPAAGTAAGGGQVYLAWNMAASTPSGYTGNWNPGTIMVATAANVPASSASSTGQYFTSAVRVSGGNLGVSTQNFAANPQLTFTGNNSVAPVISGGKVTGWTQAPGQLVTSWEATGDQAGGKYVGYDTTAVNGVTIGGANATPKHINDAIATGGTPANIAVTTDYSVPVTNTTGANLTGYTLANISVTVAIQHPDLSQISVQLISPTGIAYTLVQNRQDVTGTSQQQETSTGVTPGLSGTNLGFFAPNTAVAAGYPIGTTFSDDASRRVGDPGVSAPYLGTFYPDVSFTGGSTGSTLPAGSSMRSAFSSLTAAAAVGTWTLRVIDNVNGPNGPPVPPAFIWMASVSLNYAPAGQGLRQTSFTNSPNTTLNLSQTGLTVNTPTGTVGVLSLQGSANTGGPFVPSNGSVPQGIGQGATIAVDRSLGQNDTTRFTGTFANPRAPVAGLSSGRLYLALNGAVDLNNNGLVDAGDDVDVFLATYDTTQLDPLTGGPLFLGITRLNTDTASDNFSQGLRYQYNPALATDPQTGTLAASWFDARYDASNSRFVTMLTTSSDGGQTFSPQVSVNQQRVVTDVITGQQLSVEPLPTLVSQALPATVGLGTNPLAVQINGGKINVAWAGNPDAPGGYVYAATARTAAGPQVVYGDVGAIGNTVTTDAGGNSVIQASQVQLDNPIAPTPPRYYLYNASRAGAAFGGPTLSGVADGTPLLDGIRVVFDRRMDPTSFNPEDVKVFFQGPGGGSPVELRTLYPGLTYRIDDLSAQTTGVTLADPTAAPTPLNSANIVTADTDFVIRFIDSSSKALFPVGLVGTYSYSLSPFIRDRVRNLTTGGITGSASVVIPATATVSGAPLDPVTASYTGPTVYLGSRNYAQPGSTTTDANKPVYAADGSGLTKNLALASIPSATSPIAAPSGTTPSSTNGVTDVPITFPSGVFPTGQDKIARALVQVDLVDTRRGPNSSAYDGIILQLISPSGKVIPLTVQDGGDGSSYDGTASDPAAFAFAGTVFDSLASQALEAGGNNYQGTYRPVGRFPTLSTGAIFPTLLDLNGDSPSGTWYLRVIDNFNDDNQYGTTGSPTDSPAGNPLGYLRSWSITVVPGSVSAAQFGTTAAEKLSSPRRGNFLDSNGDGTPWQPVADNYLAPRSTAPLTLTAGPYQTGGKGLFEQGPFDKATLPLVVGGPRVLGVSTSATGGRSLNDQVYLNTPAANLYVRFDRAVDVSSISPAGIRITGPSGLIAGPFTVTAGATPDEVVIGFSSSAGGSFTRGGSYTVQLDSNIKSAVGDLVDVNQNAGVDQLFGGNASTAAIQTVTFASTGGPVQIRSAPVVASAGAQTVTGQTVAELAIPVSQSFQIAQDLSRYPNSRLTLSLSIKDTQNLAAGEVSKLFQSLTADLVAPDGTRIRLFTGLGNSLTGPGTVNTNIVFDDAALSPIGSGVNPFQTAPYNPQIPLARLLGKWSYGTWKVVVTNTLFRIDPTTLLAVDVGQILGASLTLTRAATSTGLGETRADQTTLGFRVYNQDPTSKESSQVWQAVGASPSNNQANVGRVSAVTIDTSDPTGNTVFAAGASGGVWKTTDFLTTDPDGPSWVPLTDFGPSTSLNVASIAVFPRNNDPSQTVVFALTGEGNSANLPDGNTAWTAKGVGVLRSIDGGQTWTLLDSSTNAVTAANAKTGETVGTILDVSDPRRDHQFVGASGFKIIVDPTPYQTLAGDPNRTSPNNLAVYMAVSDTRPTTDPAFVGGVYRSLDSGRTWTRIGWGNATDVAFAPGAVGPDGNLQTVYLALLTAPGVTGGVYITRQATNVPAAAANTTGSLTFLQGGGGNNVIRDQLGGQNTAVGVNTVFGPFVSPTRITLAVPAATNNPLANNIYQSWLYAVTSNADGSVGGLFLTKDFGSNWTQVQLPELRDASGNFWGENNESTAQAAQNLVTFDTPSQFTGNVGYTRNADSLSDTPRTYVPRPGSGSAYGTTPRATGQGAPGANGSGGTGNRALSLAVDPLNPAVVYLGGDRSIRVDTSVVKDAESYYYFDNTNNVSQTLLNSNASGGVSTRYGTALTMLNLDTGVGYPLENGNPALGAGSGLVDYQWGVVIPGSANSTDTANGQAEVYRDKYGLPAGFVNLSKDPSNPFLNPSVIQVYNAGTFTNTGENASLRPFDNILFGSYDVESIVPFVDPQTGKTRLIYATANGLYTGVDTGNKSGASLDVAIGDSSYVSNPTQVSGVVTGPRNGNLQIGQYYQGAVQSSRLAADIAGALFYAVSQDNGYPVSGGDELQTGSTAQRTTDWPGTGLNVAVDTTGTGTAYQYRLPSSSGTDTTNTNFGNQADFFRLQLPGSNQAASGIGRTNNLLTGQNPFSNGGDWPLNDTRYGQFTVNPLDGAGIVISAAPSTASSGGTARVFRSIDRGLTWQNLGAPAGAAQYISALAFGGPDANFPTQRNNYILAGTGDSTAAGYSSGGTNGEVFFTVNGTLNSWVRVPGDTAATGGRSVLKIVPNPRFGTSDFYVLTDRNVFYVSMKLDRSNPAGVTATWTDVTGNLYGITRTLDSLGTSASGTTQTTIALRDLAGNQLDLTSIAVDWRYTDPVLYVAGDGGTVFRTVTFDPTSVGTANQTQATWTSFPDNPTGSYADGGYLPNVRITDLDLSLGSIEQNYDPANPGRGGMPILGVDPTTGLPRSGGGLNLLVATTYGRGQFVTRINPADPALNAPNDPIRPDAFVSGPKVSTIAFTHPDGSPLNTTANSGATGTTELDVVFDAPVDPVTLTASDITLLDPSTGNAQDPSTWTALTITGVTLDTGVPSGQPDPRNRYTITFTNPDGTAVTNPGFYYLQVGSSKDLTISDLAGNRMNQNANLINGETYASPNGDDTFTTFVYLNGSPHSLSNSLLVSGVPSKVSTQAPTAFSVTAIQANGAVDTNFAGTVTLSSATDTNVLLSTSSGPGVYPSQSSVSYTFAPSTDAGRHAFTVTFRSGAAITNPDGTPLAPTASLVGLFQTVQVAVSGTAVSYNPGQIGASVYNARVELAPASLPAAVSTWDPQTTTANLVDFNGNRLPAFGGTISLSSSDGNALLPAALPYTAGKSGGTGTFSPILFRTKGTQTLTYAAGTADGVDPLTIKTAVANAVLAVTGFAVDKTGNLDTSTYDPQSLTVTVRSALDGHTLTAFNLATGPQATVSVSTDDPLADITPPVVQYPSGSNAAGTTTLLFRTAGTPTHKVTFSAPLGVDTTVLNPIVQSAQFQVLNPDGSVFGPAQLSTWNPQTLTVNLVSPVTGKVLPNFAGDVTVTSSDPLAAAVLPDSDPANPLAPLSPSGQKYSYTAASAGSRVDSLLFRTGSTLSSGGTAQSFAFSSAVGVAPYTVGTKVVNAVFAVTGLPSAANGTVATAGSGLGVNVAIADPLNNFTTLPSFVGTVTLGTDDKQATLAPNPFAYTAVNNGNKAFVVTYRTSGSKSFTASTPVGVDPYTTAVPVQAAAASKLTLGGFPTPATVGAPVVAGTPGTFTVTAFDPYGNVATGYTGVVKLTSNDPQATGLPTTYTFAATDAGTHTFSTALKTVGNNQQLVASEQGGASLSASQTGIVIVPAAASQFTVVYPTTTTAGDPHPLVLKASDAYGNTATTFTGTVTFTSTDPLALPGNALGLPSGLPADYTFTASDQGQKVFDGVELRTVGTQTISAGGGGVATTASPAITVQPAKASTYSFSITSPTGPPYSVPAGGQVNFQLVAKDRFGNTDTNYTGTVQFSSSDKQASLPGTYTFTPSDGGQKGFASFLYSSGNQTITATDSVYGAVGSSPSVSVQPAAAGLLNVAGFPSSITAGDSGTFSVTLFDSKGNVATGFTGTVSFSSSDPTAVFALASAPTTPITKYTFSAGDAGTKQFVSSLTKSGLQTLTVTPVTDPAVNSGTVSTTVQASAATGFTVSDFPSPVDAGSPKLVRVTARDKYGNQADSYGGLVRLTSSDPAATLPPQTKLTNGTAFFLVTLNTAGTQSITASDTLNPSILGSQGGISVTGSVTPPTAQPPTVSTIPASTVVTGNAVTQTFTVTTYPLGADANSLVYTASASNPVLLPQSGLVFGGSGNTRTLTATPVAGQTGSTTVTVTVTDPTTNLSTTTQFGLTVNPVPPPPPPPPGSVTNYYVVGSDIGVLNEVSVYNTDGTLVNRLQPFAAGYTNGTRAVTVRQADGSQLIAAVPGSGLNTQVKIIDPKSGAVVRTLDGFESSFEGGLLVAAGDVNGDGVDDIAISADQGGGGRVRVYDGRTYQQLADFFGIDDPTFRGGARVAMGDLNGDGHSDLIVSAGFGGGPRVALFDGSTIKPGQTPVKFVGDFFVFEQSLRNGTFVSAGDINGDGKADLVVAGGPGGGPRVFVLDGQSLLQGQFNPVANFFAGDPDSRGGVRVAVKNLDGDKYGDIVTGDGSGAGTQVRIYYGADILKAGPNSPPALGSEFDEQPGATNGVFVG